MLDVKCKACGKRYNYEEWGCCPNCGAYNRPPRRERVTAEGDVHHISDAEYRDKDQRTRTQGHKVCFEKKVCYEDQAHGSTDYAQPSAFSDGYLEDDPSDFEEEMDDRFDGEAQDMEDRFDDAADRFSYTNGGHSHTKTVNFDVEGMAQKLSGTFDTLLGDLKRNQHKSYTQRTGSRSSEAGKKVGRIVVRVVTVLVVLNVLMAVASAVWSAINEDIFTPEPEPAIPEKFAEIYDGMDWLGEAMSLLDNETIYGAEMEMPFVIGESVGVVDDYQIESGADAYGWGQIVSVKLHWKEGHPVEPILLSESGRHDWESNYYWEIYEDEEGSTYQFLIDSEEEDVRLKVVFEDYSVDPTQEVQIDLQ